MKVEKEGGGGAQRRDPYRIELEVREFLVEQWKARMELLRANDDLYGDLGIWGDDVDDFFIAFAERFELPLGPDCGLDLTGCFPGEGFRFTPFRPTHRYRVGHLIAAAKRGEWPQTERIFE